MAVYRSGRSRFPLMDSAWLTATTGAKFTFGTGTAEVRKRRGPRTRKPFGALHSHPTVAGWQPPGTLMPGFAFGTLTVRL